MYPRIAKPNIVQPPSSLLSGLCMQIAVLRNDTQVRLPTGTIVMGKDLRSRMTRRENSILYG